jgi:3-deoxy-D-manno-octulosonic-acid transferase
LYYRLYTVLGWLLVMVAVPFFMPFALLTGKRLVGLRQRLGFFDPAHDFRHPKRLWFHAASVGEVQVVKALIDAMQRMEIRADIIITTVTEQGLAAANRQLGPSALCLYAPIDLPWVVARFLRKLRPSVYICLETELWPTMLRLAKANGVPTLLLNGRLSESSLRRYQKIARFMEQVVNCFTAASVIRDMDRERFLALGLMPGKIAVYGNAKYDLALESLFTNHASLCGLSGSALRVAAIRHYQRLLGLAAGQPVLVAGSTHSGEEAILLTAFQALLPTIPDLVLIIAPRHLERLQGLKAEWHCSGIAFQGLSQARMSGRTANIVVVDQMGELARLYAVATYVFCGGSLVARGGHNIMEPALWGKPPLYGPHMHDFMDARALL